MYGKFTYGYNIPAIVSVDPGDLTVIDLDTALVNTLNITAGLFLLLNIVMLLVFAI